MFAIFGRAESFGITTYASRPQTFAASATAVPWLPDECVATALTLRAWASGSIALSAPRYLKAPPCWRFSHLNTTRRSTRLSKLAELITGVRTSREPMRSAAAATSANVGMAGASGCIGTRVRGREQPRTVVPQLGNGFMDISLCQMRPLLHEALHDPRRPPASKFLERTHIKIAVVEKVLEFRHVAREKAPILADAIAAHGRRPTLDQGREKLQG